MGMNNQENINLYLEPRIVFRDFYGEVVLEAYTELLPRVGEFFKAAGKDYRVTQVDHEIDKNEHLITIYLAENK